jgi:hypothetical protein
MKYYNIRVIEAKDYDEAIEKACNQEFVEDNTICDSVLPLPKNIVQALIKMKTKQMKELAEQKPEKPIKAKNFSEIATLGGIPMACNQCGKLMTEKELLRSVTDSEGAIICKNCHKGKEKINESIKETKTKKKRK